MLDAPVIGDQTGTLATPAARFLDSLGVCTHVAQGVDDPLHSADAMSYAGIRNFRDDGKLSTVPAWSLMHQRAGVKGCILGRQNLDAILDIARRLHAEGALLAVEGPNEPNNFPVTYLGARSDFRTTFLPVAYFQRDLYAAVKADPQLAGVPVFHSSEAGGAQPDNVGLQFLTIPSGRDTVLPTGTQYADYANVHNYVCGHRHELTNNVAWKAADPTLAGDWDGMWAEYGETWHRKFKGYSKKELLALPRVSTETGWWTEGKKDAISEEQQASLYLDVYLSSFKQGFAYTFLYKLRDDPKQGYTGIFHYSWQPKPAARALHSFTSLLGDTRERVPGRLDYTLEGGGGNVHDLLLQKSDGRFVLIVWGERFDGQRELVRVRFGREQPLARVFDPLIGEEPTSAHKATKQLALTLTDHPLLVELTR
jgi:hypothetical protein